MVEDGLFQLRVHRLELLEGRLLRQGDGCAVRCDEGRLRRGEVREADARGGGTQEREEDMPRYMTDNSRKETRGLGMTDRLGGIYE